MSNVFHRATEPPVAVRAEGCWIYDNEGNGYLDAAGGAVVVNVGHGDPDILAVLAGESGAVDYVHPSVFTTESAEAYAKALAPVVPVEDPRVYPVSGGSEAVETALKLARSYHLARDDPERTVVIGRSLSYHGSTLHALDVSDRARLRAPYEPWLGRSVKVPPVTEYRCPATGHPNMCARWHASQLEEIVLATGPERVAAFIGEAMGGATVGASPPPDGYWEAIKEICDRYGVLLVVDEVMTGFGRTGKWFGVDHQGVRPDILVAGKGASSGYWPLGLCVASGVVHDVVAEGGGFVHGFTYSHSPLGCAVGLAVLRRLQTGDLVNSSAVMGARLIGSLRSALNEEWAVGDVRGSGLFAAVELVSDRTTKSPFRRSDRVAERVARAARDRGLLVYPSTGGADGVDGDLLLLGPPFVISAEEISMIVDRLLRAVKEVCP